MSGGSPLSPRQMLSEISKHDVFAGFGSDASGRLDEALTYQPITKNCELFTAGDQPNMVYYLLKGSLTLQFPDNSTLQLREGELVGEIGVLNGDFRLGTLTADTDGVLIAIDGERLFDPEYVPPTTSLTITRRLSRRVTDYLRSVQQTSTPGLILEGENSHVEFKSTLRWNLHAGKKDKAITHAIAKTIAAFLNTNGGTLLVGVGDDGTILGLDADQFETEDKMLLFLTSTISTQLGTLHLESISFHTEQISGKSVLRIDVQAGSDPCYLPKGNTDHFFIRTGPSTTDLRLSEVFNYISRRFSA